MVDLRLTERWFCEGFGLLPTGGSRALMRGPLAANVQGLPRAASTCWWLLGRNSWFQLELFQFERPMAKLMPADFRPCDVGYARIGIWVEDFDATLKRLAGLGSQPLTAPLGAAAVRPNAIVSADGSVREVDAIVVATGFHVTDSPTNQCIIGRGGHSLAETWQRAGAHAYKGSTVHGFPNLFVMTGPGTGSGHTSAVFMIESQLNYLRDLIRTTATQEIATVEVREDAQRAYNTDIQRGLRNSVWETGGCSSWYRDKSGKITTQWPGFTFRFRQLTRTFDLNAYHAVHARDLPAATENYAASA